MTNCKEYQIISSPQVSGDEVEIVGIDPIQVEKSLLGTTKKFVLSIDQVTPEQGEPGESASIKIGEVKEGETAQVTNSGTDQHAILNFTLPKGDKGESIKGDKGDPITLKIGTVTNSTTASATINQVGNEVQLNLALPKGKDGEDGEDGKNGLATGISSYLLSVGNPSGEYNPLGNYTQGTYIDLGDNSTLQIRKVKIRAWVTIANTQNWITLRLNRGSSPSYINPTVIKQIIKHSEGVGYVGQVQIDAYVETTDRYVGFTFADNPGGNYSSDGVFYGDYGIEGFIIP